MFLNKIIDNTILAGVGTLDSFQNNSFEKSSIHQALLANPCKIRDWSKLALHMKCRSEEQETFCSSSLHYLSAQTQQLLMVAAIADNWLEPDKTQMRRLTDSH